MHEAYKISTYSANSKFYSLVVNDVNKGWETPPAVPSAVIPERKSWFTICGFGVGVDLGMPGEWMIKSLLKS